MTIAWSTTCNQDGNLIVTSTASLPIPTAAESTAASRWSFRIKSLALILLAACVVVVATWAGFALRQYVWEITEPIRYEPDMRNAYFWGTQANQIGYVDLYDHVVAERPSRDYGLDYVPLRLLTMTLWTNWTAKTFPAETQWQDTYAFNRPLLLLNGVMELIGATAACLLTRLWVRRGGASQTIAWTFGLLAGLLLWFNPAMIFSGHARPTWDVWIVPFYLLAMWLACTNRWFLAGAVIAIGAQFKGQQLAIAAVFIVWPLLRGQWRETLRWIIGFVAATALVLTPWMLTRSEGAPLLAHRVIDWPAIIWTVACVLSSLLVVFARRATSQKPKQRWILPALYGAAGLSVIVCIAIALPSGKGSYWLPKYLIIAALMLVVAAWFSRGRRPIVLLCVTVASLAVLSTPWTFHGSNSWYEVAIRYGADKFSGLEAGGTASMAGIAALTYGLRPNDVAFTVPLPERFGFQYDVSWQIALGSVHIVMLLLAAWAMARADRRNDRTFLIAMAAPWVTMFAFAPGMHERYLLWGAAFMATGVALGAGPLLLYVALTLFSWVQALSQIMGSGRAHEFLADVWPGFGRTLLRICRGTIPGLGWAIAIAAVIVLYLAFIPYRRSRRQQGGMTTSRVVIDPQPV